MDINREWNALRSYVAMRINKLIYNETPKTWEFYDLESDPDVTSSLSSQELAECFSTEVHQANLDVIWKRLNI